MHAWRNHGHESRMYGEIMMASRVCTRIFARVEGRYAKLLLMPSCFAKLLEAIFSCFAKIRWMPSWDNHQNHMLALSVDMISSDGLCYNKRLKPRFSCISHVQLDFPFKTMACLFKLHSSNPFALLYIKNNKNNGSLIHHSKFSPPFKWISCYFHVSILVCFGLDVGCISFKLGMVLSLDVMIILL
jgi:hypothetical protein